MTNQDIVKSFMRDIGLDSILEEWAVGRLVFGRTFINEQDLIDRLEVLLQLHQEKGIHQIITSNTTCTKCGHDTASDSCGFVYSDNKIQCCIHCQDLLSGTQYAFNLEKNHAPDA